MSDAERAKNYRDRKREEAEKVLAAAPEPPETGPGEVLEAVEGLIASISAPDPVLSALARRLARHMDRSGAANHQESAELRRTINDLRGRSRAGAGQSGLGGVQKRPNKVAALRGEYQATRSKRTA